MATTKLSEELSWRGFVNQTTYKNNDQLDQDSIKFYWGVDPSASSMTIGNLAMAMMVRQFVAHGHKAVLLVGGATGMIGDPDGKSDERELISVEQLAINKQSIIDQYKQIFSGLEFEIVDNYSWFKNYGYLDFLRDIGKHMPMSQMLQREFVQSRLGNDGSGISYAEFSYSLIQGYDFLHLYKEMDVTLQVSGSDQWGNSIAGVELIRRITGKEAHVWTGPLVINKTTGQKFGKTEDGAIWLNDSLTSVYKFYQFWLNLDDDSAKELIKMYTLLDKKTVDDIVGRFESDRASRLVQKTLALEVTKIVHGPQRADEVTKVSEVLFGDGKFLDLTRNEIELLKAELITVDYIDDIFQLLVDSGLASSKSEARNFIVSGAISLNGTKLSEENSLDFVSGANLLKRGKNSFAIINK